MNSKLKGNKAESVVLSLFIQNNIPVLIPFGDNEKYDLVIDLKGDLKSVQVKSGRYVNGCIIADSRHRIGAKRLKYETYGGKVDFIAIWCEELNKTYLISILESNKTGMCLRIEPPKNNSCISTVIWAKEYELSKAINKMCS